MTISPVRCSVQVPQDPAGAFTLFATRITEWWRGKTIGKKPPVAIVIESFVGGRWYERDADGAECDWGRVLAWEPPAKLLLGWQLDSQFQFDPDLVTEVELCFHQLPAGGTEVTLEHRQLERLGRDAPRVAALLGGGWATLIGHYRAYTTATLEGAKSMTPYLVHSIPGSPYGRAVCATLEEKCLPWRLIPLNPGTLKNPEHRARHPFGKMPVLEKDGQLLYETQAILRHLDRVCPTPPLTPAAPADAARMDQVIGVIDSYFFPDASRIIVFERLIGPVLMGHTPDEKRIAAALPDAQIIFAELARLLGDRPWFGGETFSLADLMAGSHLELFARVPEWQPLTTLHPNLNRWLARVEARPSMQATRWEALSARVQREAAAA